MIWHKSRFSSRKIAFFGILIALAMILGYVEYLIPISWGIPGMKLGLANLVAVVCLYVLGFEAAFFISMVRVILLGITFGNMSTMIYSMAGAILSILCMFCVKRYLNCSMVGISMIGGISHNIGQILVAMYVVETAAVLSYLPLLLISGTLTGALIGMLGVLLRQRIEKIIKN